MNAGVDFVRNPVKLICILRGSGVFQGRRQQTKDVRFIRQDICCKNQRTG